MAGGWTQASDAQNNASDWGVLWTPDRPDGGAKAGWSCGGDQSGFSSNKSKRGVGLRGSKKEEEGPTRLNF
ncbi:uncharacterized protein N7458_011468 [Penicillium daleae]|uniref:Uncharacterized protein n=1 Tax=Penicillium daleae TaxID=63821 RepID=A0AAD6BVW3_9EURO|nr:uncharacterized protein N7458_011468 [Penicillium daleae]KAJ5432312.1 hypothetical protein N7458_011468 [Penicillium daleae]